MVVIFASIILPAVVVEEAGVQAASSAVVGEGVEVDIAVQGVIQALGPDIMSVIVALIAEEEAGVTGMVGVIVTVGETEEEGISTAVVTEAVAAITTNLARAAARHRGGGSEVVDRVL